MGTFQGGVAVNPATGGLVGSATLNAYSDVGLATPTTLTLPGGSTGTTLTTSVIGAYSPFTATVDMVWLQDTVSGYVTVLVSHEGLAATATSAQLAAEAAQSSAAASQAVAEALAASSSGITGAPSTWPSTFPPSSHSHASTDLRKSDGTTALATAVAALLTSADAQGARAAIGAGTGNGTSDLVLGTLPTQAASGTHTHASYQTEQDVLDLIAANGGGGSSANVKYVVYASGAYPAQPATLPGIAVRIAVGPAQPTYATISGVTDLYVWADLS